MAPMRVRSRLPRRTFTAGTAVLVAALATLHGFADTAAPGGARFANTVGDARAASAADTIASPRADFDALFTGATLRIDFHHSGTASGESMTLDSLREEGEWAGSRTRLIDDTNYGSYLLRMLEASTDKVIFSRGFSSLFAEWRTTDEAKAAARTMHESVLAPMPVEKTRIFISARTPGNGFHDIFNAEIDPRSISIVREPGSCEGAVFDIAVTGPPAERLDILFVSDGYDAGQEEKFRRDARRFTATILGFPPFSDNRSRINVRGLWSPSPQSGTDEPRKGIFRKTAVETSFNTFGVERYLTAPDNRRLRDAASCAPYDRLIVLVNSARYGGAGIHDQWAVVSTDNEYSDYVLIHEFGHALAGLGDEYFTSQVAYNDAYPKGVEPWEPNLSALIPDGRPKWSAQLTEGVAVPTLPGAVRDVSIVGAYEGAGYAAKGLYRPSIDCMMFSKGYTPFDPVCRRAIEKIIERYSTSATR
jgi:hypothetical protein